MALFGQNKNLAIILLTDKIKLLIDSMQNTILKVVNENNSEFNKVANSVLENVFEIVNNNTTNDAIKSLFDALDLVGATARDRYLISKDLYNFGTETLIAENVDVSASLATTDLAIGLSNIALAFDNAAQIEYEIESDLKNVIEELDNEYQRLISDRLIDADSRVELIKIRTATTKYFTQLELKTINTVETNRVPASILSYNLYANSLRSKEIINLNGIDNTAFIEGSINVLSS